MKLKIIIIFSIIAIRFPLTAQNITNISVSQRTDGSGFVDVNYNLLGAGSIYYISMEASFNNGTTFTPVSAGFLSDSIGPVAPGTNKHILWNGKGSNNNTYSTQTKVKLIVSTSPPCGQPFTDARDGKTYNTVQIGAQCWMKENLNIGTRINGSQNQTNNGFIDKYCYNDLESNCDVYGGLYQWAEMVQYLNGASNTANWNPAPSGYIQGICPVNWHVPTDEEWCILTQYVDPSVNCAILNWQGTDAGSKLKESGTTHWNYPNTGATNVSGFTLFGSGHRDISTSGSFSSLKEWNYSWTVTPYSATNAWQRQFRNTNQSVFRYYNGKGDGGSVRCIRDN